MRTAGQVAAPAAPGSGVPTPAPAPAGPGELLDQTQHAVGLVLRGLLVATVVVVAVIVAWQWWTATPRRGMASRWEIRKRLSARAARRRLRQTRPSLAAMPWRKRRGLAVTEYAVPLGRARRLGTPVFSSPEQQRIVLAPARSGKTGTLGNDVLDAPGALVVTSTKSDILDLTAGLRAQRGPVLVLNPEGLGEGRWPSTLRWSPVYGCEVPAVARDRAGYLVAGAPMGSDVTDGNFWEGTAARVLRSYLHAAALAGMTMQHVLEWVHNAGDPTPVDILRGHPQAAPGWAGGLVQLLNAADGTTRSIWTTLGQTLEFLSDPEVAAVTSAGPGEQFDVARFLEQRGTLYLLGSIRPFGSLAPLMSAFSGYLFETAKQIAGQSPGGRLDPWLTMLLDEAPLICPVPLDRWLPDSGGRGIRCIVIAQSRSQLYQRWGTHGGNIIWDNANVKTVLQGMSVTEDLNDVSMLCGEIEVPVEDDTPRGERPARRTRHLRTVQVMSPSDVRMLKEWEQILIHTNVRPLLISREPVWKRRDVRAWQRAQKKRAHVEATAPAWVQGR